MNAADRRRLTPVLGVIAVVLALLLVASWLGLGRGAHWHDRAALLRLPQVDTAEPAPNVPPLTRFSDVWQRPLFSQNRAPEQVAGGNGGSSGNLRLTGVIMRPGLRMAILHDLTTGKDFRVVEGQPSKGGPALLELHPRSAVVEASGARLQLRLVPGPSPYAGARTAPASGAGVHPAQNEGSGSGKVLRRDDRDSGQAGAFRRRTEAVGARALALQARIKAARRNRTAPGNEDAR